MADQNSGWTTGQARYLTFGALAIIVITSTACGQLGDPTINQTDPAGALDHYQSGNQLLSQGAWARAIDEYTLAIASDPSLAQAYNNRALGYIQTGEADLAVEDLNRAISASGGGNAQIFLNLGNVHLRRGILPPALEAFERALEFAPEDLDIKNNLAVAFLRNGDLDRARTLLDDVLGTNPNHGGALANLGAVLDALGLADEALRTYRRALDLDPDDYQTLRNLGLLEAREGLIDDAIGHLRRFVQVAPASVNLSHVQATIARLQDG